MVSNDQIWTALSTVMDPEIPVLSVVDLGIITDVSVTDNTASIKMTPTFSGCPAIRLMEKQVHDAVMTLGFSEVLVETNFDVQWNTNRISAKGKEIIKSFGLAPPPEHHGNVDMDSLARTACPHCNSVNTTMKSPFGPTLCRSLHYCFDCLQAFEAFKPVS